VKGRPQKAKRAGPSQRTLGESVGDSREAPGLPAGRGYENRNRATDRIHKQKSLRHSGPEGWEVCREWLCDAASVTAKWEAPYGEVCIGVLGGGAYNFVRYPVFVVAWVLEAALRCSPQSA
jgi:hypothetical protein